KRIPPTPAAGDVRRNALRFSALRADGPRVPPPRARDEGRAGRPRSGLRPLRFAAEALHGEGGEVGAPALIVLDPELIEVIPGKDAGVVQIVEFDAHRVIADRFEIHDADMGAAGDDRLVA